MILRNFDPPDEDPQYLEDETGEEAGICDDCPGGKCACWVDANEDELKMSGEWG